MATPSVGRRQDAFGLREIGLTLSNETGDVQSLAFTKMDDVDLIQVPLGVHTKRDAAGAGIGRKKAQQSRRVTRYFPGQAPTWVVKKPVQHAPVAAERTAPNASETSVKARPPPEGTVSSKTATRVKLAPVVLSTKQTAAPSEQQQARRQERDESESSSDESDSEVDVPRASEAAASRAEADARRARVRAKLNARRPQPEDDEKQHAEQPTGVAASAAAREASSEEDDDDDQEAEEGEEDSSDSSSSSSGEEEDEDEEEEAQRPVFVPKAQRETVAEAEALALREKVQKEKDARRAEARREESRAMVATAVVRAEDAARAESMFAGADGDDLSEAGAPPDDDGNNGGANDDAVEFEAWRARELNRATRDAELRARFEAEAAETERRRALTQEEREAEDRATGKGMKQPKAKWKFLQKYHHKGAFFMDDDSLKVKPKPGGGEDSGDARPDVRTRDTDGAVGVDKFDRAALPKVLQVKDFGFAGRTKYTHLVDQDTTYVDRDYEFNGWIQRRATKGDQMRRKYDQKMAGMGDIDRHFASSSSTKHRRSSK